MSSVTSRVTIGRPIEDEVTTEFTFRGAVRIAGPFFATWFGRSWARGLATLKRMMESGEL